uniref:Carbohydrate sulfotransferase n=1 Tax=Ciona savignyi TaxID=51511 RepID=H2ZI47_CIOSA
MCRNLYKTRILVLITIICTTMFVINTLDFFNSAKFSIFAKRKIQVVSERDKYIKRSEAIRELCAVTYNDPTNKVPLRTDRFKYSQSAKTVLSETPKVASTSWQIALLKLGGFEEEITAETMTKWAYSMIPNQLFSKLKTEEEAIELLHNYTTILVTRHPFERL